MRSWGCVSGRGILMVRVLGVKEVRQFYWVQIEILSSVFGKLELAYFTTSAIQPSIIVLCSKYLQ